MAQPSKRKGYKKRKGKIKFTQRARIAEKNDKTRVAKKDTLFPFPQMRSQMPRSNGVVFKVKIKKRY